MEELSLDEKKQECFKLLKYIDLVCRTNDIEYFLAYGTLLGAVRHNGFIPWDDDIDIMVPFDQFEKLMAVLKSNDAGYILYDYMDLNTNGWGSMYSKLDNGTTFCIDELNGSKVPGISVDIFPLIYCQKSAVKKLAEYERMNARMFSVETGRYKSGLKRLLYGMWNSLGNTHSRYVKKYNHTAARGGDIVYFSGLIKPTALNKADFQSTNMIFENSLFAVPTGYDKILKIFYGDYMVLPPEVERVGHNAVYKK